MGYFDIQQRYFFLQQIPALTAKNKKRLQYIQDSAFRIIYKKPYDFDVDLLHEWSYTEKLESRAKRMITNFFDQAATNSNPLIIDLVKDFSLFINNFKNENIMTILDYKNETIV